MWGGENLLIKKASANTARKIRHIRLRKKIQGNKEKPRLCVFRSSKHIYAQIIDDSIGRTLVSASTLDAEFKSTGNYGGNITAAKAVGDLIAKRAIDAGITTIVFDRGGYLYHGRVAALADAARAGGLQF